MTVIIFLLDNTPSMLQQTIMHGVRHSYIDIAKQTVELFLEQRESDAERKDDRYMLLTYDKPPNHVKAGWKEHMDQFRNALNTLQCTGSVSESNALNNVFDLLNQERVMVGMDTYGYGRCPFNNMFSFIVLITNYRHYPYVFSTPMPSLCPKMDGSQLTKEPYRWDQRFFALILGGSKYSPYIEKMTHVMGGWYMLIRSKKTWDLSIAKLLKSIQFRLIVNVVHETGQYARIDETTITSLQPTSCAIVYCEKSWKGSWPFPESEWSYMRQNDLLPRLAFPEIRILPVCCDEPIWMVDFPVDKYELQQRSSSGNRISLPSNDQGKVWPVVIMSSTTHNKQPFGYVKEDAGKMYLYVLVYDYPELHRLMMEHYPYFNVDNAHFLCAMVHYISTIPPYYCFYLRKALSGILENTALECIFPNESVYSLGNRMLNSLNQMRQNARLHRMQLCDYVSSQQACRNVKQQETAQLIDQHPLLERPKHTECTVKTIIVPTIERSTSSPDYRNLYAIDRRDLLDMMNRMRNAFYYPENMPDCMNSKKHEIPILQMQNYTPIQENVVSMRTLFDSDSTECHMFSPSTRYNQEQSLKNTPKKMKLL